MEEIYPPNLWRASEKIPLINYFEDYNKILPPTNELMETEHENNLQLIKNLMEVDIDLNELKRLSELCSSTHLTCDGEDKDNFPIELPEKINSRFQLPKEYIIASDKSQKLDVIKCKIELEKKRPLVELTFGNKRSHHNELPFPVLRIPENLKPGSDFIVHVMIFKPFAFNYSTLKNTSEKIRFNHEILALGSNTLTELRDAIICSSDVGLCKEVQSIKEDLRSLADAKKIYPSGCIYIDDVFYNDFRSPNAIDYSSTIIQWAKDKEIGEFKAEHMENVRLNELKPRLGYPYVYIHQGDCEHLLVFSDARLLQKGDCLHYECYPHVSMSNRMSNIMCHLCGIAYAKWILMECDRFPQDKCFLCTDCCNSYNYINDEKVGNFKLYPFYEKHVVS